MDEHTDWVNQLIYLNEPNTLLSCSNDTSIKVWKLQPEESTEFVALNSFYTMDFHNDYVRAMSYSAPSSKLFSVSDDGRLIISDLNM